MRSPRRLALGVVVFGVVLLPSLTLSSRGGTSQLTIDHFKCYVVAKTSFKQRAVLLSDQFVTRRAIVVRPVWLCNPVRKNRGRVRNPRAHLKCYVIREQEPFQRQPVDIENQFESTTLTALRPSELCLPTSKRVVQSTRRPLPPGPVPSSLDHFKCYTVTPTTFRRRLVTLTDQFETKRTIALTRVRLCNPVSKNRRRIQHPEDHLVCYTIAQVRGQRPFARRVVAVRNQFGLERLTVLRPLLLCVPSTKEDFEPPPPQRFTKTVTRNGDGSGTVLSDPPGIECGPDCSESYAANTLVTVTATPDQGSTFGGWSGDCAAFGLNPVCQQRMDGNKSDVATFNRSR